MAGVTLIRWDGANPSTTLGGMGRDPRVSLAQRGSGIRVRVSGTGCGQGQGSGIPGWDSTIAEPYWQNMNRQFKVLDSEGVTRVHFPVGGKVV